MKEKDPKTTIAPRTSIFNMFIACMLFLSACGFSDITAATPSPTFAIPANENSLYSDQPWLVYLTDGDQTYVTNNDGTGLTPLLSDYSVREVAGSSTSNLVAMTASNKEDKLSFSLLLVDLPDTNVYREIPLLSFFLTDPGSFDDGPTGPMNGVIGGIQWSPDGRYLAFMGAIETPSSALYVYDSNQNTLKRISQNDHQAVEPIWSPDGRWIIYKEVSNFHGWATEGIWAASLDGTELKMLYKPTDHVPQEILGWTGDDNLVVADKGADGRRNIRIVNIKSGTIKVLFPGYFLGASLDTLHGMVAFSPLSGAPGAGLNLKPGTYLVSAENTTPKRISPVWISWDSKIDFFVSGVHCENGPAGIIAFNSLGDKKCIAEPKRNISPNNQFHIVMDDNLNIYQMNGGKLGTIPEITGGRIIWRPDSNGFFVQTDHILYYVAIENLIPQKLYQSKSDFSNFTWVGIH
jgi:hypothetical protein